MSKARRRAITDIDSIVKGLPPRPSEALQRNKEEPQMNTDKQEALARQAGTFQDEKSEGVTTGVRDGDTQGQDARVVDPDAQVQNDGADDVEVEEDEGFEAEEDDTGIEVEE